MRCYSARRREHLSPRFRQYSGESRGRWEEDMLVVEVTNFNDQTDFRGAANIRSEEFNLVERFTRVDKGHDPLSIHGRGSEDLDETLGRRASLDGD